MANEHFGMHGIPSFYPTPTALADILIDKADIRPGEVILEPSAGLGHLAARIQERYPENKLYVIEKDLELRLALIAQGYLVVGLDFFQWELPVDVVIQNPPFSNNYQDINHFCQAWRVGRKVVSLVHEYSAFTPSGYYRYKPNIFQKWLEKQGIHKERTQEGSFLESEQPSNVRTAILWGAHHA